MTEYQIQWHWLPDLASLPDSARISEYRRLLDPGETLGWTPTEESLERAHRPSERLEAATRDGVAGFITRIEVTRQFDGGPHGNSFR